MFRLALLLVTLLSSLGCSSGGGGTSPLPPGPQWSREGADNANSRNGGSLFTNEGTLKWVIDLGAPITTTPAVGPNGTVYIASQAGRIFALTAEGTILWTFDDEGRLGAAGAGVAVDLNDQVYFGTVDGFVFALDSAGQEIWRFDAGSPVRTSPALEIDFVDEVAEALFIGTEDGRFLALGAETGEQRWRLDTGAAIVGSPAFDIDLRIYVASADGVLHSVSLAGANLFRFPLGAGVSLSTSPMTQTSTLVQATTTAEGRGRVVAVTQGGTQRWAFDAARTISVPASQVLASAGTDLVQQSVTVDDGGSVYLLDVATGRPSGTCIGGEDEGKPCWVDLNCVEGVCSGEVFFAAGEGISAGPITAADRTILLTYSDASTGTGMLRAIKAKTCISGDRAGAPCRDDADCEGEVPGTCDPPEEVGDEVVFERWIFNDGVCVGGDADGAACAEDEDCPGEPVGLCEGRLGTIRGAPAVDIDAVAYFGSETGKFYALGE